ncbi:MAG: 30S ribosome-binding factor RbfA [Cytophagaceae bacterium]|jgi:ribosome-binding factor A|nr:30S ribosome-binding factor RbfA [Cytophagaceae bacterium]
MDSIRQQKVGRAIQKELADIFIKEGRNWWGNQIVSVTVVRMSPDLSVAKVFLSMLMAVDKEDTLKRIRTQTKVIRKLLGEKVKKQMRIVPELVFYLDDNVDYANHIDDIMSKIDIPPPTKEVDEDTYPGLASE